MKRLFYILATCCVLALVFAVIHTTFRSGHSQQLQYKTNLSPDQQITIVRRPPAAKYGRGILSNLPVYVPSARQQWQVDLRSYDLRRFDLSGRIKDLLNADFDSATQWPKHLPKGFDPDAIMKLGKEPGINIRQLHEKGITGKGISIAIIDQGLLVDHVEYADRVKLYEEIHCGDYSAQMHGPAVASIALGKTVGVAPEANLYYIAETHGTGNVRKIFEWDLTWLAKSIDRLVEVNQLLPKEDKIRVISISLGVGGKMNGYEQVFESIEKAKMENIYTVYVDPERIVGLERNPLNDVNTLSSHFASPFRKSPQIAESALLFPMNSRCTASPTGTDDYVFYRKGGMSWTVPYVAGLYALACQVQPDIKPEEFWTAAKNTAQELYDQNNGWYWDVIDPVAMIEEIQK